MLVVLAVEVAVDYLEGERPHPLAPLSHLLPRRHLHQLEPHASCTCTSTTSHSTTSSDISVTAPHHQSVPGRRVPQARA